MADDRVLVPLDAHDGFEELYESGELDPEDREAAQSLAADRGFDATATWLEKVGDNTYARAARGDFAADDET